MSSINETRPSPRALRRPPLWQLGLGLVGVLALVIGGAAWAGYSVGQDQRTTQMQATLTADLKNQYELGLADLTAGHYSIAATRFEYVLQIDPRYPGAAEGLALARNALNIVASPTPQATPTLPPNVNGHDPAALLALAQQAAASENWDAVIAYLASLRVLDADYETVTVDGLLFEAMRARGVARIIGDQMELGITDLDQAEAFGVLDEEAANYRRWAKLYLAAQSYWGVNWERATLILQELYLIAPYFKDTAPKLYLATLKYAAQLDVAGDDCGAALNYAAAQALAPDPNVANTLATAQAACAFTPTINPALTQPMSASDTATPTSTATIDLALTPTPTATPTATVEIVLTPTSTNTPEPSATPTP